MSQRPYTREEEREAAEDRLREVMTWWHENREELAKDTATERAERIALWDKFERQQWLRNRGNRC